MKTAMQVAIEHFKNINYDLVNVPIKNVPHILEQFLEKEKEQIINAANSAYEDKTTWGERYYNQTYGK